MIAIIRGICDCGAPSGDVAVACPTESCDIALDGVLANNIRLLTGTQLVKLVLFCHVMISCFVGIFLIDYIIVCIGIMKQK